MNCLIYRLLALVLCLGCLAQLAACRDSAAVAAPKTIRIGITVYDQYDTFVSEMIGYFESLVQQKEQEEGITISVIRESADGSQEAQNNQVESLIEAGCDVLCVNMVDRMDASVIIDKAGSAGLPVIFFNRELVEEDLYRGDRLYYVGAAALESGRMQGQIVARLCRSRGEEIDKNSDGIYQYVMLEGEAGHQDAIMRTQYSVAAVEEAGFQLERLEDEIANWVRAQAESKMLQWLDAYGNSIEIVFANNDEMALGAIDALKRNQVPSSRWPVVVGIDGTSYGLESVRLGEMAGTVYNDARGQAQGMLHLAYALSTGTELPPLQDGKYIRLPYSIVTAENVGDYMDTSS